MATKIDSPYNESFLLDRIYDKDSEPKERMILATPQVEFKNKRTFVYNFGTICDFLNRNRNDVMVYFLQELKTNATMSQKGELMLQGRYNPKSINKIIKEYVVSYVICSICKSEKTDIVKEDKIKFVACTKCNSRVALK
jgi:translation initiation factor 2 subunit 2